MPLVLVIGLLLTACAADTTQSTVQHQVQALFEMPTVEMVFRDVVYHRSNQRVMGVLNYDFRETLFRVLVRVQAGFDLSSPNFSVVQEGGRISINLPKPKILMADADDESLHEYFTRDNNIGLQLLQERKKQRVEAAKVQAIEQGILGEAARQARLRVGELLNVLGVHRWELSIETWEDRSP